MKLTRGAGLKGMRIKYFSIINKFNDLKFLDHLLKSKKGSYDYSISIIQNL